MTVYAASGPLTEAQGMSLCGPNVRTRLRQGDRSFAGLLPEQVLHAFLIFDFSNRQQSTPSSHSAITPKPSGHFLTFRTIENGDRSRRISFNIDELNREWEADKISRFKKRHELVWVATGELLASMKTPRQIMGTCSTSGKRHTDR